MLLSPRSIRTTRPYPTRTPPLVGVVDAGRAGLLLAALSIAACARPGEPGPATNAPSTSARSGVANALAPKPEPAHSHADVPAEPAPSAASAGASVCDRAAAVSGDEAASFRKVHEGPAMSLGLGHAGRAAILTGTAAHLFDGKRWIPLEPALPSGTISIFFGRDNAPRVMGFSPRESGEPAQVYLRCRQHRCQPAPDEIGRLGGARGALYGVLGFDDPEVVCRVGQICLIKRVSGWKSIAAHASPARVLLSSGTAFALHPDRIERVTDGGFVALSPARSFEEPRGVALQPNGVIWVIDRAGSRLSRLFEGEWQEQASPIGSARALFARANDDLWIVGEDGAARFDGERWSCVAGVAGPLEFVSGYEEQVWLAGRSGVFLADRVRSLRNRD